MRSGLDSMEAMFDREATDARHCLDLMCSTDPIPFHWRQEDVDKLYHSGAHTHSQTFEDSLVEQLEEVLDDAMDAVGVIKPIIPRVNKWYLCQPSLKGKWKYWIGLGVLAGRDYDGEPGVRMRWYVYDKILGHHSLHKDSDVGYVTQTHTHTRRHTHTTHTHRTYEHT